MAASDSSNSLDEWLKAVQDQFDSLSSLNIAELPFKVAHTVEEWSTIVWESVRSSNLL